MAITLADFNKIWASTSPLTPYSFSESNYKEGWNFIGGTPPARQMWDFLQKNNDEKMKYIVDNFLPLSGGTMTGTITLADGGNPLSTIGGTMTGAIVGNPLTLSADDGNDSADLVLNSSGSATWNGKEVERVNSSSSDYIRFQSGLQICWGSDQTTTSGHTYTFPVSFDTYPKVAFSVGNTTESNTSYSTKITNLSKTSFKGICSSTSNSGQNITCTYIAVGYWK